MKVKYFLITLLIILSSCDFNINDSPGSQISSSIKESQSHSTYLSSYQLRNNKLNGVELNEIFMERAFWREEGLFAKKKINCCESQLVIVSKQPFSIDGIGYEKDWKLSGFELISSFKIYKKFNTIRLPDSILISVVKRNKDSTLEMLYRIK